MDAMDAIRMILLDDDDDEEENFDYDEGPKL